MNRKPLQAAKCRRLQNIALLFTTILIGMSALMPANASAEQKRVQQDVKAIIKAVYSGNVGTVLQYTHPKIIKMMGGAKAARASVAKSLKKVGSVGLRLESLSFPSAPVFLRGTRQRFVIVPTYSVFSVKGQRVESLNYQFGVLEKGAKRWKYVEGSRVNKRNIARLFPEFPRNYTFPRVFRKKL